MPISNRKDWWGEHKLKEETYDLLYIIHKDLEELAKPVRKAREEREDAEYAERVKVQEATRAAWLSEAPTAPTRAINAFSWQGITPADARTMSDEELTMDNVGPKTLRDTRAALNAG